MRTFDTVADMIGQPILHAPNYRVVKNALAQLAPFNHSTMSARWEQDEPPSGGDPLGRWFYVVYSYKTPIAWVEISDTGIRENGEVGGVTTSKHLGYCRVHLPGAGYEHAVREWWK